jgi:hypothetical protein
VNKAIVLDNERREMDRKRKMKGQGFGNNTHQCTNSQHGFHQDSKDQSVSGTVIQINSGLRIGRIISFSNDPSISRADSSNSRVVSKLHARVTPTLPQ